MKEKVTIKKFHRSIKAKNTENFYYQNSLDSSSSSSPIISSATISNESLNTKPGAGVSLNSCFPIQSQLEPLVENGTLVQQESFSQYMVSIQMQTIAAMVINILAYCYMFEPFHLFNEDQSLVNSENNQNHFMQDWPLNQRLAFVFENCCFPLLWVLFSELYKEYLRIVNENRSMFHDEISLTDQMIINSKMKSSVQSHIRSLSQLVLILVCQLGFVFDPKLSQLLAKMVPTLNCLFFLSRIADLSLWKPKRYRLFASLVIYFPIMVCLLLSWKLQIRKWIIHIWN